MRANDFSIRANQFIMSLIRMRTYLNKHHLTKGDIAVFEYEMTFLREHLRINGYRTDNQMAGFWMRHHDKISCLIPGKGCSSSESLHRKFYELKAEAGQIYTQYLITPQIPAKQTHSQCQH